MASGGASPRLDWLDIWRGLALAVMVVYHLCYDLVLFGLMPAETMASADFQALHGFGAVSFIFVSGLSARLSRSNLRRGLAALLIGTAICLGSLPLKMPIYFGALQLLGCCMLIYGLLGKYISRFKGYVWPVFLLAAFIASTLLLPALRVEAAWLFPLGLTRADFVSYDYYPLLPWLPLFLLGAWAGDYIPAAPPKRLPPWLTWPGRHSLLIYLAHQPLLLALVWAISKLG